MIHNLSVNNPFSLFDVSFKNDFKMIGTLHVKAIFLLIIFTTENVNYGLVIKHQLNTVVKYQDEDYYLKDGCPLPDCDDREPGCFKSHIELKKKFNGCYR